VLLFSALVTKIVRSFSFIINSSVLLRTTPMNSTGVAHVLEHVALCGSEQFPVRDPFFKMLNRSMSSFMNALTGNLDNELQFIIQPLNWPQ